MKKVLWIGGMVVLGVLAALLRYVTDQVLVGRLHNIDLAGSERLVRQSTLYCLSLIK